MMMYEYDDLQDTIEDEINSKLEERAMWKAILELNNGEEEVISGEEIIDELVDFYDYSEEDFLEYSMSELLAQLDLIRTSAEYSIKDWMVIQE